MKLNFKDLKQQKFSIDAEPSDTVADVKQKVAAEKDLEAAQMRLIWSGKILVDANTIGSYEIKPTDQIVCMVQKPKAGSTAAKPPPSTPTTTPAAPPTPVAPAPAPVSSAQVSEAANPPLTPTPAAPPAAPAAPAGASTSPRSLQDSSTMMLGPERQAAIANVENMGFERAQVERAMRAAYYNPDRAVEYLLNGIPESVAPPNPASAQPTQQQASPQPPAAAQPVASPPTGTADLSTESEEPVNLFEAAAAANQGSRGAGRGAATAPSAGAGQAVGSGSATQPAGTTDLNFLRDNPTFQHLRQLVQQQPAMLEQVLQNLSASNPQLAQTISQNQEQFVQLLAEDGGEGAPILPPGAQAVSVTPEERDAIERLCRLGFDRDEVIQAYFACDKNEELAANYLFDNPPDDVEQ